MIEVIILTRCLLFVSMIFYHGHLQNQCHVHGIWHTWFPCRLSCCMLNLRGSTTSSTTSSITGRPHLPCVSAVCSAVCHCLVLQEHTHVEYVLNTSITRWTTQREDTGRTYNRKHFKVALSSVTHDIHLLHTRLTTREEQQEPNKNNHKLNNK